MFAVGVDFMDSQSKFNQLILVMETSCVLFELGTEVLNI
jgi:hypothetical protein